MSDASHDPIDSALNDQNENAWGLLRQAREARGLSLGQVSAHLKLTVRQIEAIECGDLSILPGQTFARGFVRNYARFLGLDPSLFLSEQAPERAVLNEVSERVIGAGLGQMPAQGGRRFSALPALFLVALLLIVLGSGWHYGWFEAREDRLLLESASEPAAMSEPQAVTSHAAPIPVAEASQAISAPIDSQSVPASALAPLAAQSAAAVAPVAAPAAAPAPVAQASAQGDGLPRLVFGFDGDSWVEVRDATGKTVFSRLNTSGTTQEVQGTPPFEMVIGNAPFVRLTWKGVPVDLKPVTRGEVARITVK